MFLTQFPISWEEDSPSELRESGSGERYPLHTWCCARATKEWSPFLQQSSAFILVWFCCNSPQIIASFLLMWRVCMPSSSLQFIPLVIPQKNSRTWYVAEYVYEAELMNLSNSCLDSDSTCLPPQQISAAKPSRNLLSTLLSCMCFRTASTVLCDCCLTIRQWDLVKNSSEIKYPQPS